MTSIKALIAAVAVAACAAPLAASAQQVVPVQFARGTSSVTVNGAITGYAYKDYRVSVVAGQTLEVSLRGLAGSPYFNMMEPGSRDVAIYNSSMGEQRFSGVTKRSGAYTIRVYLMRAMARRNETARFALNIAARRGAATQLPGDALVPGTHYHATASIRCRTVGGGSFGMCKAGVIRRAGGGATLHLDTPDGGERTILFREGRAVSSDSQAGLTTSRVGDMQTVRIGTVEIYEVPDALIVGG